jgi:hypothetical protein
MGHCCLRRQWHLPWEAAAAAGARFATADKRRGCRKFMCGGGLRRRRAEKGQKCGPNPETSVENGNVKHGRLTPDFLLGN